MNITKKCPFCGKETSIDVSEQQAKAYADGAYVQEAFSNLDVFDREVIITGVCYDCQEKIFNKPTKEHTAAWGDMLGACECCGCNIYKIHNKSKDSDDSYTCPGCHMKYSYDGSNLVEVGNG